MEFDKISYEYINVDEALARIGGNMGLYKKLLIRFIEGNHIETLENALASGDMEESARLVHTLKGVSANLSLNAIMTVSISLEQAIKQGLDFSAHLKELKQVYSDTSEKILEIAK